jgi:sialate O-acetylesterase
MTCSIFCSLSAKADVSLPPVFSDHMVLQRDQPINLWGKADPGETIRVAVGKQSRTTVARKSGDWSMTLGPLHSPLSCEISIRGKNRLLVRDVQLGDVWLFSGQSNILWPLKYSDCTAQDTRNTDQLKLRIYEPPGKWKIITERYLTDLHLPAIPFLFARGLKISQDVPIGILLAARGAVPIETFLPPQTVKKMHERHFQPALMPPGVKTGDNYQVLLKPVLNTGISGIIWYQGEANYQAASDYRYLFPWFITDWRKMMRNSETPLYFVQIPNHGDRLRNPVDSFWADLRESQTAALALRNVHMVVAIDTVHQEPAPLHPKEKREIAQRLLNLVRANQYGARLKAQGPMYRNYQIKGRSMFLAFDPVDAKLVSKDGGTVQGFQMAGKDKIFHRAKAILIGNRVRLSSPEVPLPVAARYAWEDNPMCNIYSNSLPLPPFRTDQWTTHPKLNPADWPK